MKKVIQFLIAISLLLLCLSGIAGAYTYTYGPVLSEGTLPDSNYYIWGIDLDLADNELIVAASISTLWIQETTSEPNTLYFSLLDSAVYSSSVGVLTPYPDPDEGDHFAGEYNLFNWTLTYEPTPMTYNFDSSDIGALMSYLANDNFGIGIDPECFYYTDGFTLSITTVPEPATMLLLGTGLIGLAGLGRKKLRRRG